MKTNVINFIAGRPLPESCATEGCALDGVMRLLDGALFRCDALGRWESRRFGNGFAQLTGYEPHELGQAGDLSYADLVHREDRDAVREAIVEAVAKAARYRIEYRIRCKNGSERWVLERGAPIAKARARPAIQGFIEDISGYMRTQSRLAEAEIRYRSIFDNSAIGIFQTSPDGSYISANPALARLYKYDTPEALQKGIRDISSTLYADPSRRAEFLWQMQNHGMVRNFESEVYCRDGSRIWISENAHVVHGVNGEVLYYEGTVENITERRRHEAELEFQATHDALTGLPNRILLQDRLEQAIHYAKRYGYFAAVVFVDLDNFKYINDSLGHEAGDRLLIEVARRLRNSVRATDTVARYGGDEFVMVLNNYYDSGSIARMLERVLTEIALPVDVGEQELRVSCSIGVCLYPNDGEEATMLLKHADAAMYLAKQQGKSNYKFFTRGLNDQAIERVLIENGLRNALERGEIQVAYQAKVDGEGNVVGFEALARWHSPSLGQIAPDRFIPIAEESGLIEPITQYVLRAACRQAQRWVVAGFPHLQMAVNLSVRLFGPQLSGLIEEVLAETGLAAEHLELEITESVLMRDVERCLAELHHLKAIGISLAIDDFGTGYSSLAYLKRFPIDTLKIDKTFVRDADPSFSDTCIAEAIVSLGRTLGMKVVAEGVETEAQYRYLQKLGCHEYQGYLFARPQLPEQAERMLWK